jgi:L-amino acid N-acyltransferase YncA
MAQARLPREALPPAPALGQLTCQTGGVSGVSAVVLRAVSESDLDLLTGGESEFDDWGPRGPLTGPPRAQLEDDGGMLTIEADGEVAGHVSWHYVQWGPGNASRHPELGIWLRSTHRGRGIGVAAQRQLAGLFFEHTRVNRVQAGTDVTNLAEQRALERAGFSCEGVIRQGQWRAGAYHDLCLYAIVRGDLGIGA